MAFVEDLSPFFVDFGDEATLAGSAVRGMLNVDTFDEGPGVLTSQQSFLLQPGHGLTPAAGDSLVLGATTYTVRQVLLEPPDGAMQRLVLVRA